MNSKSKSFGLVISQLIIALLFFCIMPSSTLFAQPGFALDFDGSNDYVNCGSDPTLNIVGANITIEAWIYPTSWTATVDEGYIIAKEDLLNSGYLLRVGNGGILQFTLGNGVTFTNLNSSSGALSLNQWQHVAGVFDGSIMKIYINGELVNSVTTALSISTTLANLIIGSSAEYIGSRHFLGRMDEIRLWGAARTQEELVDNMFISLAGSETGLQAYYKMTDGTGTSLTDNSTNSNTGTLTNMDGSTDWLASTARIASSTAEALIFEKPANGLAFGGDGSDDYVGITDPTNLQISGDLTIELWAELDNFTNVGTFLTNGIEGDGTEAENDLYSFKINTDKTLSLSWEYGGAGTDVAVTSSVPADILANEWHHFSAVRSATDNTVSFYVDGVELGTPQAYINAPTGGSNSNLNIGADVTGGGIVSEELAGTVDDLRIWNTVRTGSQIRQKMNQGLVGNESNLQGYLRFNASSGTTATDKTSNSYDGTLTNIDGATAWVSAASREANKAWADGNWSSSDSWFSYNIPNSTGELIELNANITMDGNYALDHISVSSGKTLTLGVGNTLTHSGNVFNEGTITGSGNISFTGSSAQTIAGAGSTTAGTITLNNASGLSLEQDLTISTGLTLTNGALSIADNTLTINGSISTASGSLTGGSTSNIVVGGAGATLSLPAVSLNDLTLNRSNGLSLASTVRVDGTLTLTDGIIDPNSNTLVLGSAATIAGTPSASRHVNGDAGTMRKEFSGTGSFTFPLGDGTVYSPISLNFSSGTFSSAFLDASVCIVKHPNNASVTHFLSRYWTITNSGISDFSAGVTAIYDDGDINGTESEINSGKWDGSSWTDLGDVIAATNTVSGTVTSFSDFTGGEPTAFPVEWLDFSANFVDESVQLDWTTATEVNSDKFIIERSEDFQTWTDIGELDAAGYSQSPTSYKFIDGNLPSDQLFYRLRQVDLDGQFDYSSTVQVFFGDIQLSIYPNPVSSTLHLDLNPNQINELIITSIQGKTVFKQKKVDWENTIDIEHFAPGMYTLRVKSKNGKSKSIGFIKQ